MATSNTMRDYLNWRGDLTFAADPFNEVDNLILAQLSYVDYDGIVGEGRDDKISIVDVCEKYWQMHTEEEIKARESFVKLSPFLLKPVARSRRFSEMKLSGYVNYISKDREAQMSAVQFELEDGTTYVAFRGTDETIVGWKEDFNLSYMSRTEGQRLAVEYLEKCFKDTDLRLRVGGHSKGGNFAIFASAFAHPEVRKQIEAVYTNDGPGFREEITATKEYNEVLPKIRGIIPSYSIIGKLLSSGIKSKVVKSSGTGIMQHDALTWQIMGNRFQYTERANDSIFIENVFDDWIKNVDDEARRMFVDQVFSLLEAVGADTMKDVKTTSLSDLKEAFGMFRRIPKERQKEFSQVLTQLIRSGEKNFYGQIGDNGEIPEIIRKWAVKKEDALVAESEPKVETEHVGSVESYG